jgi:putative transposase
MARVPRYLQLARDAAYHVMSRGHNREALLASPDDKRHFLGLLARYRQRFGFRRFYYCLMDTHFHVLLHLDGPRRLSALMAGLLLAYVRYFNRRYGFVGHQWQGRFRSPLVQRRGYWLSWGGYIERNPVEASLVARPWDYRWSSCRHSSLGGGRWLGDTGPGLTGVKPGPRTPAAALAGIRGGRRRARGGDSERGVGSGGRRLPAADGPVLGRPLPRRQGRPRKEPVVKG